MHARRKPSSDTQSHEVLVWLCIVNMMITRLFATGASALALFLASQQFSSIAAAPSDPVDRGPTLSATIRAKSPGDNVTMKGVVVTLGSETNAFICYDTDLMRVSL